MKVRFQADADLNEDMYQEWLGGNRLSISRPQTKPNLPGLPDLQVLALAAQENRILVTHDRRTMPRHFASFVISHECPGVVIIA
jgi:predicted nuclease of predicted toxin-antitoxin system